MKTLLTTTAFVALLATAPAFAEDYVAPAAEQQPPAATEAAPDQGMAPADPSAPAPDAPAATTATDPATAAPADPNAPADTAAQPADENATVATASDKVFIDKQAAEDRLASNWIGQTIYNQANESVGDVNDLLIGKDGQIHAVIIGVGGFLGIGEKNVAVAFDAVSSSADENGNLKFMVSVTKEELDAAPEFMTLADIQAQSEVPAAPAAPDAMAPAPAPAQ